MSYIVWQTLERGGGYELLFGNLNDAPDFQKRLLDRDFQRELESRHYMNKLKSGMLVHVDDSAISIGVYYAQQPRLFQLPRPSHTLLSLFRAVPRSSARAMLASYIRKHPREKKRFHHDIQQEEQSPDGLIGEFAQLKKPLKLIRIRHLGVYSTCHWHQYDEI